MVTLYHWDLPQTLQDIGGWPNPELVDHYLYYVTVVFENLGDLIQKWMTFNEPKQVCQLGYGLGGLAPGVRASGIADYKCAHTLLTAHAKAYHLYNEKFKKDQKGTIGIVIDTSWYEPIDGTPQNVEAAERALQFAYGWFANPVVYGNYPQVMVERIGNRSIKQNLSQSRLPEFSKEESSYIKKTFDFIAINCYSTHLAIWENEANFSVISYETDLNVATIDDSSWEPTAASYQKVVPWGIRKLLNWVSKTYNHPEIYITENGYTDSGGLDDKERINYYKEYLSNVIQAIVDDGINVTRYTTWSLLDNFEWNSAYSQKYGLFSVDFDNPQRPRTAKASAAYYAKIISTKCLVDKCVDT